MDYIAEIETWVGDDDECKICVEEYMRGSGSPYTADSDIDCYGSLMYVVIDSSGEAVTLSFDEQSRIEHQIHRHFDDAMLEPL